MSVPNVPGSQFRIRNRDDDGLRMAFDGTRTNDPDPDTMTLRIWGLNDSSRARMTALFELESTFRLELSAGYVGLASQIFIGDVFKLHHKKTDGFLHVTEISTGDGLNGFRDGQMSESFVGGVPVDTVRRVTEAALGLRARADAEKEFAAALGESQITTFSNGFVATGQAQEVLTEIAASQGLKWWIKDGEIIYVRKNRATSDVAIVLNSDTGLISVGEPKELGDVEFTALLNPKIFPGRQVLIQDANKQPVGAAAHRVDQCNYRGDMHGQDFFVNGIARPAFTL